MPGRRFSAAAFADGGRPILVGHRDGEAEAVVWRLKGGRLSRLSRAPWAAVGVAPEGDGVVVIGPAGQTLVVDAGGGRIGKVTDRKASPTLRGVTQLAGGAIVAFGTAGRIYRRAQKSWEPWGIAPPLPRLSAVKLSTYRTIEQGALAGVAGDSDGTAWAFGTEGAAWSRGAHGWKPASLPAEAKWTCAASRPGGQPVVAGQGVALVGAGVKWRTIAIGELRPTAIAVLEDALFVADGTSVWRIDGKAPRLVLAEPVFALAAAAKGILAVGERAVHLSTDGGRWATLA